MSLYFSPQDSDALAGTNPNASAAAIESHARQLGLFSVDARGPQERGGIGRNLQVGDASTDRDWVKVSH